MKANTIKGVDADIVGPGFCVIASDIALPHVRAIYHSLKKEKESGLQLKIGPIIVPIVRWAVSVEQHTKDASGAVARCPIAIHMQEPAEEFASIHWPNKQSTGETKNSTDPDWTCQIDELFSVTALKYDPFILNPSNSQPCVASEVTGVVMYGIVISARHLMGMEAASNWFQSTEAACVGHLDFERYAQKETAADREKHDASTSNATVATDVVSLENKIVIVLRVASNKKAMVLKHMIDEKRVRLEILDEDGKTLTGKKIFRMVDEVELVL